ncbi:HET-domain-containing protein [Cadophora sp. DSE1049]|nr:HET-domain-containing protein [Cadophora sp. DSE1049]
MANYSRLLTEVPLCSLPQLYQDAVYVTRQLHQRYIWIDSLCIIQDSDNSKDWQREVTMMSEVYSNSFCNIVAAAAPDGEHSMFHSRDSTSFVIETVDLSIPYQDIIRYMIVDESLWFNNPRLWLDEVDNSKVNSRAWVLQERLLSVRNLYFGESQLYWECHGKDAMEVWPTILLRHFQMGEPRIKSMFRRSTERADMIDNNSKWLESWGEILKVYTSSGLTRSSDKLPAISSIAKRSRSIAKDQYVVGLWRSILSESLLWAIRHYPKPRPEEYRAPSWSWAAVDGEVRNFARSHISLPAQVLVVIEGLEIEYLTKDDTQQVQGGWLKVKGKLRALSDRSNVLFDTVREQYAEGSTYYVPIMVDEISRGGFEEGKERLWHLFKLILQIVNKDRGMYRRIGISDDYLYRKELDEILSFTDGEEEWPCEKYEDGHHYIYII